MLAYVLTLFLLSTMNLFFSYMHLLPHLIYQKTILVILFLGHREVGSILLISLYRSSMLFGSDRLIVLFMIFISVVSLIEI